ncbi:hypothetical protein P872_04865 [Rhodonellum psychrophilum GCM71 = DSM 17998]|uniref:Thioredoxin domain-containing protein n=3 Tax=Cytophagaceae TaxID=89373 RepID=U5C437_9BACT|nr:hypothetical protein P872_04865 [Rhodonellum psychrophilum GCM71 = DSM 17998]SDZ36740.1 Peroxiredoxin [Rhodonellum ikkaensis]
MFFILLAFAVFGCQNGSDSFDGTVNISGKLSNAPTGIITLSKFVEDRSEVVDTLEMNSNGVFNYVLASDSPEFYELNLMDKKVVRLALFKEDVQLDFDFNDVESLKIEGSEDSKNMLKVELLMEEYQEEINQLNSAYYEAMTNKDQAAIKSIQEKAMHLEQNHGEKVKTVITEMDGSFAALAAIGMLNPKNDFQFMDNLVTQLNTDYPNTKIISTLMQQLEDMRVLAIGQIAPEISLPDPNGEMVNLSDLRGKYVLIDFWAAWCKPCREENPNVVRLYNQYKDKGFEVFGVSLDRTKEAWVKAIADDELTWTHVSDLKYFNSAAAATYQINAIPATYLIDKEGNIIAKDLRGPSLENKLKELFD